MSGRPAGGIDLTDWSAGRLALTIPELHHFKDVFVYKFDQNR